ncbi:unnamed protein product, partial [Vitis vinifera]
MISALTNRLSDLQQINNKNAFTVPF